MRFFVALLLCCFSFNAIAEGITGEMQTIELEGKKIYYWSPETARKAPLIVLSHAFSGCADNFKYLARALAEDGFWVAAVNHKDSGCSNRKAAKMQPSVPFGKPEEWDDTTYADRRDDINTLLELMVKNDLFLKHIDFEHVGLAGHSLGGYVAMGMGGAWPSWKNHNIKAVLALSPHNAPFLNKNTISSINVPIMYQGGTRDILITPFLKKADGVFAHTHPDKYLMILDGATHFAWVDSVTTFHNSITSYSLAFFDYYLKGNASAGKLLIEKLNDVHALYYDNRMGKVDLPKDANIDNPRTKLRDKIRERIKEKMGR
ncbi:MAG: alpha/beta fold hydrolase [Alphaproteobacteria bacterium]|nr:alpha/beta fold hydrolase [Alphaproteobacteria bacterium]